MRSSLAARGTRAFLAVAAATGAAVLIACGNSTQGSSTTATASATAPAKSPSAVALVDPALVDGTSIFQTGRDVNGARITARPRALFPTCAACHLPSGAGGVHLPGGAVSADLRHSALVSGQTHPYTVALLERAISTGIDDDGKRLDSVMPHWAMSKRDLHDVAEYVLTLR
jgi:mono/diheme cytochrome c family protein